MSSSDDSDSSDDEGTSYPGAHSSKGFDCSDDDDNEEKLEETTSYDLNFTNEENLIDLEMTCEKAKENRKRKRGNNSDDEENNRRRKRRRKNKKNRVDQVKEIVDKRKRKRKRKRKKKGKGKGNDDDEEEVVMILPPGRRIVEKEDEVIAKMVEKRNRKKNVRGNYISPPPQVRAKSMKLIEKMKKMNRDDEYEEKRINRKIREPTKNSLKEKYKLQRFEKTMDKVSQILKLEIPIGKSQEKGFVTSKFLKIELLNDRKFACRIFGSFCWRYFNSALKSIGVLYEEKSSRTWMLIENINEEKSILEQSILDLDLNNEVSCKDFSIGILPKSSKIELRPDIVLLYDEKSKSYGISVAKSLFSQDFVDRMIKNLECFVNCYEKDEKLPLKEYRIITKEEEDLQIRKWNETDDDSYSWNYTLKECFEESVDKHKDMVAVDFKGVQLSYDELNKRANQLAHLLISKYGVNANDYIGICVEKSIDLIVAIVAVWKAGGTYTPLESKFPKDRLGFILEETSSPVVITNSKYSDMFDGKVLELEMEEKEIGKQRNDNPSTRCKGEDIAYVIFTSGSTGNPKGVLVEHLGIVNFIRGFWPHLRLKAGDRFCFFASISFDIHLAELLCTLLFGMSLVIVPEDIRYSVDHLYKFLKDSHVNGFEFTPSVLKLLSKKKIEGVKTVCTIGEKCDLETMKFWSGCVDNFVNYYGPTEIAVACTSKKWTTKDQQTNIGRPLSNYKTYILDKYLKPLPVGVPGMLYVGCITGGYLNREKLTREKYIPNPFGKDNIMYNTGDLAYYLPDGELIFIGRIDNQVKVRGFRVELGEIEKILITSKIVKDCIVIVKPDETGTNVLIAFVVLSIDDEKYEEVLKGYLNEKLPYYMIPNYFKKMQAFPLAISGKIDRTTIKKSVKFEDFSRSYVPPSTEAEKLVTEIFASLLESEKVGIEDDFFLLGGSSLKLTLMRERVNEVLNSKIQMNRLLQMNGISVSKICRIAKENKVESDSEFIALLNEFRRSEKVLDNDANILYRLINERDIEESTDLITKIFCDKHRGEPLTAYSITHEEFKPVIRPFVKEGVEEKLSIGAFDTKSGKLIGVYSNFDAKNEDKIEFEMTKGFEAIFGIFDIIDNKIPKIHLPAPVLHSFVVACEKNIDPSVFYNLYFMTLELARLRGFKSMFMEPTSPVTQRTFGSLGIHHKHSGLKIEEFCLEGEYPFRGITDWYLRNSFDEKERKTIEWDEIYCLSRQLDRPIEKILSDPYMSSDSVLLLIRPDLLFCYVAYEIAKKYFKTVHVVAWSGRRKDLKQIREKIQSLDYSYLISFWNLLKVLPNEMKKAKKGAINVHPASSEHPGEGMFSFPYAHPSTRIFHGCTVHELSENFLEGKIYSSTKWPVTTMDPESLCHCSVKESLDVHENCCQSLSTGMEASKLLEEKAKNIKWGKHSYTLEDEKKWLSTLPKLHFARIARESPLLVSRKYYSRYKKSMKKFESTFRCC